MHQGQTQKVTAHLPVKLLYEAQASTGKRLTKTLKIALEQLRSLKGKIDFSIDVNELRKDRDEK